MMLPGSKQASLGFSAEGEGISGDLEKGLTELVHLSYKKMYTYGTKRSLCLVPLTSNTWDGAMRLQRES